MNRWTDRCLTLLFPPHCLACGGDATGQIGATWPPPAWCVECWQQLCPASLIQCPRCAAIRKPAGPLAPEDEGGCGVCRGDSFHFDAAYALGDYHGFLKELVVRMKNVHDEILATQLGRVLAKKIEWPSETPPDLVIPMPLHWQRRLFRGFAAAEVIAQEIANGNSLTYRGHWLRCRRKTKKQGLLSVSQRKANVRQAFAVGRAAAIRGRRVLLVDDVMTTGATASEAAGQLKRAGASRVEVAVLARSRGGQ